MFQILPMDTNQQRIGAGVHVAVQDGHAPTSEMSKVDNIQQKFVLMGGPSQQIAPWLSHLSPEIGTPTSSVGTATTAAMSTGQRVVLARDASAATQMETGGSLVSGLAISEAYTLYGEEWMLPTVQSSDNERQKDLEIKSQAPSEAMNLSKPPDALDVVTQKPKPTTLEDIFADLKSIVESKDEEIRKLSEIQRELTDENETLQSTTVSLREELQWKEDVVAELARKVERLDEQIAKLHVKKFLLKQQLEKYRLTLRARDKRICGLKGAVEMAQKALRDFEASERVDDTEELEDDEVIVLEEIPRKRDQAGQGETPSRLDDIGPEASQRTEIQPKSTTIAIYTINHSGNVELRGRQATEESAVDTAATSAAGRAYAAGLGLEVQASAPRARRSDTVKSGKPYACNRCDRRYYNRNSLNVHKNFDCGKPRVNCQRCQKSLRPRSYQQHFQRCLFVEAQA